VTWEVLPNSCCGSQCEYFQIEHAKVGQRYMHTVTDEKEIECLNWQKSPVLEVLYKYTISNVAPKAAYFVRMRGRTSTQSSVWSVFSHIFCAETSFPIFAFGRANKSGVSNSWRVMGESEIFTFSGDHNCIVTRTVLSGVCLQFVRTELRNTYTVFVPKNVLFRILFKKYRVPTHVSATRCFVKENIRLRLISLKTNT